jgi:hypothetical protein
MTKEQVGLTDAMVNMDTLGLTSTEVWVGHSDERLTGALAYIAKQLNVPATGVNFDEVGGTDSQAVCSTPDPQYYDSLTDTEDLECRDPRPTNPCRCGLRAR